MPSEATELIADTLEELKEKVARDASKDIPEGTVFYHISATLLNKILEEKYSDAE